jgi:hypothetical protein
VAHYSGSEALDVAEVEELLLRLFQLGDVPDTAMPAARRARHYRQIAEITGQISEVAAALARRLAPETKAGGDAE